MTSHAAVVARGMGKTCVSGARLEYRLQPAAVHCRRHCVTERRWITVDGSTGRVFLGKVPTIQPTLGTIFTSS
jgi:pyruvate,orthophosphate dikinase